MSREKGSHNSVVRLGSRTFNVRIPVPPTVINLLLERYSEGIPFLYHRSVRYVYYVTPLQERFFSSSGEELVCASICRVRSSLFPSPWKTGVMMAPQPDLFCCNLVLDRFLPMV